MIRLVAVAFAFLASPAFAQAPSQPQSPITDKWQAVSSEFQWQVSMLQQRIAEIVTAFAKRNSEYLAVVEERDALKAELDAIKAKDTPK